MKKLLKKQHIPTKGLSLSEIEEAFDKMMNDEQVAENRGKCSALFSEAMRNGDFDNMDNPTKIIIK